MARTQRVSCTDNQGTDWKRSVVRLGSTRRLVKPDIGNCALGIALGYWSCMRIHEGSRRCEMVYERNYGMWYLENNRAPGTTR